MYYKKVNYNSNKDCFNFLANHFEYWTMNSWNGLKSIANDVKVTHIEEIEDWELALQVLEEDQYNTINVMLEDWTLDHPGYSVAFNGRSGGYLVLYNNNHNGHAFKDEYYPSEYNNYEDWKEDIKRDFGTLKNYHSILVNQVKLVQEFDKLCDDLVIEVNYLIEEYKRRQELTRKYSCTLRFQRYYYDTLKDLKLHMLDMKRRGCSVFEYSETELYVEYEMNEGIESEIVLDENDEELK